MTRRSSRLFGSSQQSVSKENSTSGVQKAPTKKPRGGGGGGGGVGGGGGGGSGGGGGGAPKSPSRKSNKARTALSAAQQQQQVGRWNGPGTSLEFQPRNLVRISFNISAPRLGVKLKVYYYTFDVRIAQLLMSRD